MCGIAVPTGGQANWRPILNAMTSFGFIQAVLVLIAVALVVGILIWLFERRHNEDFGGGGRSRVDRRQPLRLAALGTSPPIDGG